MKEKFERHVRTSNRDAYKKKKCFIALSFAVAKPGELRSKKKKILLTTIIARHPCLLTHFENDQVVGQSELQRWRKTVVEFQDHAIDTMEDACVNSFYALSI